MLLTVTMVGARTYHYDVNKDGVVSITDVTFLVNNILGVPNAGEDEQGYIYDVNGDGVTNVTDVSCLVNKILGILNPGELPSYLACPDDHHPHMINLGLPSGTLWACCNVDTKNLGNQSPSNYGGYYAWGETEVQENNSYSLDSYAYGSETPAYAIYDNLGSDIAGTDYDVAHVKWGGGWMMPSQDQLEELLDNCSHEWTTIGDVNGEKFTSKTNGVSIFLPAAGYYWDGSLSNAGSRGEYSSSTQDLSRSYAAYCLYFRMDAVGNNAVGCAKYERYYGRTVRPVWCGLDLELSSVSLTLAVGSQNTVEVTSGSGNYSVVSSDEAVATAAMEGSQITVTGIGDGQAVITVTDMTSLQTATIEVTVYNFRLAEENLRMAVNTQRTVEIISGSGNYNVEVDINEIATAVIENGMVKVTGKKAGNTTITVTDVECGQSATIRVAVTMYDISKSIIYIPSRFLKYDGFDYYEELGQSIEVYPPYEEGGRCKAIPNEDFIFYIKDSNGNVVEEIKEIGAYTLVVEGIGYYAGEASKSFHIIKGGSWSRYKAAEFSKIDNDNKVITITSEEELALLASIFNSTVDSRVPYVWWTIRLERDLDLTPYDWIPIGSNNPGDEVGFLAYFDAQGHTIKGVHFERNNTSSYYYPQGLFGGITYNGSVKNLTLTESQIICANGSCVGGIVGYTGYNTTVSNCHVTSSVDVICTKGSNSEVDGDNYGGIVGECSGQLSGCTSAANVFKVWNDEEKGTSFGGLVGCCHNSSVFNKQIVNCLYDGDHVYCDNNEGAIVGLIDNKDYSRIDHCFYTSNISKGCMGIDVVYAKKVEAFDMNNIHSVDYGGDMMASYSYDGMKVYPNAMIYQGYCYAQPQYVQIGSPSKSIIKN